MNDRYTIATLGELLAVARSSEHGFMACAQHAQADALKKLFAQNASRHTAASAELCELVAQLGADPAACGRIRGAARRGWANLHVALTQNTDEALLNECEHGEDHALEVYRNALDDHLPELVRQVVLRQFEGMMSDYEQMQYLRTDPLKGGRVAASTGGDARP
ncbi:MAG: ferritin-like domain-containing protein [Steroidobacteraceae bacterium]